MRRLLLTGSVALVLGAGTGEYLTKSVFFRRGIANVVRREELRALVGGRGIYERDVTRAWQAELFARGAQAQEIEDSAASEQQRAVLDQLIEQKKLQAAAAKHPIDSAALEREMNLLRWQARDGKSWNAIQKNGGTNPPALRREVATNLRDRAWIEAQIAARIQPNDDECHRYFDAHRESVQAPLRLRASHLFLAAPDGYPAEVIERKRRLIGQLSKRLTNGESFPALVTEFSEDEATKKRGGDLGYFAEERMLPEVFQAAKGLRAGETSAPVRSRLGFHLIRLTESRASRALTFEEAQPEIVALLENEKRALAGADLFARLATAAAVISATK